MPFTDTAAIAAVDNNLRRAMRMFGTARVDGSIREVPGITLVTSGVNYGVFNAAVLGATADTDLQRVEANLQMAARHFSARGLRWSVWYCEALVRPQLRSKLQWLLARFGLHPLAQPPGMHARKLREPSRPVPALEIRPVRDEETRFAFTHVTSVAFDIPLPTSAAIYNSERTWQGEYYGYVGYSSGVPIATTAVVPASGVVGIYSVATLAPHRRKGFAEAIMRHAIEEARRRTGLEECVLQSTRAGMGMYEKMGFRAIATFQVFVT